MMSGAGRLARRWLHAAVSAIVTSIVAAIAAEVLSFLVFAGKILPGDTAARAAKNGLLLGFAFQHVGLQMKTPTVHLPGRAERALGLPSGVDVDATVAFAFMLGTVIVAWLLYRAGRSVGRRLGGDPSKRATHGATVALLYAAIWWSVSWFLDYPLSLPGVSPLRVHPSHTAAFFWPLFLGLICCIAGAVRSTPPAEVDEWLAMRFTNRGIARWHGAFAAARRMLLLGAGLTLVGLLALMLVSPDSASAYFSSVADRGFAGGVAIVALCVFALPNMIVWMFIPAMGGCLDQGGGLSLSPPGPYCFLSYSHSVSHRLPALNKEWGFAGFHDLGSLNAWFLFFLLIPLIAAVFGGYKAARIARPTTRREVVVVAALSAGMVALTMTFIATLSLITLRMRGTTLEANDYLRYGPYPAYALQLGLGWAFLGGIVGGLFAQRRNHLAWEMELLQEERLLTGREP